MKYKNYFSSFENFMQIKKEVYDLEENILDYYFYKRLLNYYQNWEDAFDVASDFLGAFFIQYEDSFAEFSKKKEIADILYGLEGDDYTVDSTIATYANNSNQKPSVPSELLDYFNTQNYSQNNMKKLEAYTRAWQVIPRYIVEKFIKSFAHLFMSVITEEIYLY